jgi:hypothetical protein
MPRPRRFLELRQHSESGLIGGIPAEAAQFPLADSIESSVVNPFFATEQG